MCYIDVAQVVFPRSWLFFAGLVFWLRREDRREGYPLESEVSGHFKDRGFIWIPEPKTFILANGEGPAPHFEGRHAADQRARRSSPGRARRSSRRAIRCGRRRPRQPRPRPDEPYRPLDGHDLLAPLRVATNYAVPPEGGNPIGFEVVGARRRVGRQDQGRLGRPRRKRAALLRSRAGERRARDRAGLFRRRERLGSGA